LTNSKNLVGSPTRTKAHRILQREQLNVKKSKIHSFLIQQLITSYGTKRPGTRVNEFINNAVNEYLKSNDDVNEEAIGSLERFVKHGTDKLKNDLLNAHSNHERAELEEQIRADDLEEQRQERIRTRTPVDYSKEVDATQWTVVNAILSESGAEQDAREKKVIADRRADYKKQLDSHQSQFLERKEAEEQEVRSVLMNQRRHEEMLNKRADEKVGNSGDKVLIEKTMRFAQIREKQERQARADEKRRREEAEEIQRVQNALEEDRQRAIAIKEDTMRRNAITKAENERFQAIKDQQRKEQEREELRLQVEGRARADREDKRRKDEFNAKMERQEKAMSRFAGGAGAQAKAKAEKESNSTQSAIDKKYRMEEERERVKQEKRDLEQAKSMQANATIVERKRREKEMQLQADRDMGAKFQREKSQQEQERVDERTAKLEKMRKVREMLDAQVGAKQQGVRDLGALTNLESNLNKDILAKIKKDPEFAKKVHDRVKPKVKYASYTNNIFG
jgi:hypothetical protein